MIFNRSVNGDNISTYFHLDCEFLSSCRFVLRLSFGLQLFVCVVTSYLLSLRYFFVLRLFICVARFLFASWPLTCVANFILRLGFLLSFWLFLFTLRLFVCVTLLFVCMCYISFICFYDISDFKCALIYF